MSETEKRMNQFFGSTQALNSVARSEPERFSLKVVIAGSGGGSVRRSPELESYANGQIVSLTANPDMVSKFVGWSGDVTGAHFVCNLRMDSAKSVSAKFVAPEFFALTTACTGTGTGEIERSVFATKYAGGTAIALTARANAGSKFKCWTGDATGLSATCTVTMDSIKTVSAEFIALNYFGLTTVCTGTSAGTIERSVSATQYLEGTKVTLTARGNAESKFKCWHGDATGLSATCTVTIDSIKTVSAEFIALNYFGLTTVCTGTGAGTIERSVSATQYVEGTKVTLTARANKGSKLKCWDGDASGHGDACAVTMDSSKKVSAEFIALESFPLDVTTTGTGSGNIDRSIVSPSYFAGTEVTLTAVAEEGSIFNGWYGDVTMMDEAITVTMSSAFSISAEFVQLAIVDTEITAELVSTTRAEVKKGQTATVFRLMLRNNGKQQVRVKVPLTSYVSQSGQTSEQSGWAAGRINGSKGVTLSAGTFCEMGLVHFNRPAKGDRLYVTVEQVQPTVRMCFTFQCTGYWNDFLLISAGLKNLDEAPSSKATYPAMASALKRIESLENTLAEVLRRLDVIQRGSPMAGYHIAPNQAGPVQTLSEVLAWLAEHEQIGVAKLRARLLPLDLLSSAVIAELNEQALDLTGELALEEVGDLIVVARDTLLEVLANGKTDCPD